jgi:hypothetical protein
VDYQIVDAQNTVLTGNLSADRRIGLVRARSIVSIVDTPNSNIEVSLANFAPTFIANADHEGDDGVIDLIDVKGNCGALGQGGPSLYTGPNGNVRYMRVGGLLFASNKFG